MALWPTQLEDRCWFGGEGWESGRRGDVVEGDMMRAGKKGLIEVY